MNLCGLDMTPRPGPPDPDAPCCYASAFDPDRCDCWQPIHDRDQETARAGGPVTVRTVPCRDCAYRPGSPELESDDDPPGPDQPFWCHQGMRRVTGWRHPSGATAPPPNGDHYDPPIVDGIPRTDDGDKADLCAGWLAQHAATVDQDLIDERFHT